jgi:hypothetical protein
MSNGMRGLRRSVLAAVTYCLALALFSAAVHAQSFTVTNLTNNPAGTKASYPDMVVDANGNTYLVWADTTKGVVVSSNFDGTKFNTQVTIQSSATVLPAFQPQIAVYNNSGAIPAIEIVWASLHAGSNPATYDVYASRMDATNVTFTAPILVSATVGPVPLADTPRLAFDHLGRVNVVWGQTGVWISQAQDGTTFGPAISLLPVTTPATPAPDTGGPRIAVDAQDNIFVVWTDEANKNAQGSYCTIAANSNPPFTNMTGGYFWINETLPSQTLPSALNTRNLSNNDWFNGGSLHDARFPNGFFGCSYDNLKLFTDPVGGLVHLIWSDDSPDEDVLTSESHGTYPAGSQFAGETQFSFPINLAAHLAASPNVAADQGGNFYLVWSGGTDPSAPQGIFFRRYDVATDSFSPEINVAPTGAIAPAFPQVAVDSKSNVNIAWEQSTAALSGNGSPMFNVFFARSTDGGKSFPTVLQVSTNPSILCYQAPPPPQGTGAPPTTPDVTTCGTVQLGVGTNATPELAWVNQANPSAAADIDFATASFPTGSVSPASASLSASTPSANFTVTVNGFSGSINFSCLDGDTGAALPSWLTCTFNPDPLTASPNATDALTITRAGTPTASMFMSAPSSQTLPPESNPMALAGAALAALGLMMVGIFACGRRRNVSTAVLVRGLAVMTLTVVLAAGLVSCGGSTSSPSTTSTSGSGGSTGTGGSGGTGGTTGGSSVTVHVLVQAQSGNAAPTTLGTVTITAQ